MKTGKRRTSLVVDDELFYLFKDWCEKRQTNVSAFLDTQMRERVDYENNTGSIKRDRQATAIAGSGSN